MRDTFYTDFRDAFFEELFRIAKKDPDVILLMADQGALTFKKFKNEIPKQIINAGTAEQNMIGVAAGLAMTGKKVFVHAIANFTTLRCYEQIKVDLSIMNLPVTIVGVGAGFAYTSDGPTHHANQDIAAMRAIPNMKIFNASDTYSLAKFANLAYKSDCPVYIRFDKGNFPIIHDNTEDNFKDGFSLLRRGKGTLIISTGIIAHKVLEISGILKKKKLNIGVMDIYRLKPINELLLLSTINKYKSIVTIEEHIEIGGLGSIIGDLLAKTCTSLKFKKISLPDSNIFVYGDRDYILSKMNLDSKSLLKKIARLISKNNY